MNIATFVKKNPKKYVRFGKCATCGAVVVVSGTADEFKGLTVKACHACNRGTFYFGINHNADGRWAERKYSKLENDNSREKMEK